MAFALARFVLQSTHTLRPLKGNDFNLLALNGEFLQAHFEGQKKPKSLINIDIFFGKEDILRVQKWSRSFVWKCHSAITENCFKNDNIQVKKTFNMKEKFKNLKTNIWYWSLIIFGKKAFLNCGNKVDFKEHEKAIEDGLNVACICGCSEFC